jgi:chemotaxis protein CheX
MKEAELKYFIDVVVGYFREISGEPSEMGIPFIKEKDAALLDYTGLIGISGAKKGAIYLTATRAMLSDITTILLGEENPGEALVVDMAGEIANTIAGNVRENFGSSFMISVPIILRGCPDDVIIRMIPPIFIIPIKWRSHSAFLAVGLE